MKKVIDFNNTWCKATQENYNKLIELEYSFIDEWDTDKFFIDNEDKTFYCHSYLEDEMQIKLNSSNEFEYVEQQPNFNDCSFAKYGFKKPNFECEIKFKDEFNCLIGACSWNNDMPTSTKRNQTVFWNEHGECYLILTSSVQRIKSRDLTPIKKPWYENEDNFPCVLVNIETGIFTARNKQPKSKLKSKFKNFRPATKEEVLSLVVKDKN